MKISRTRMHRVNMGAGTYEYVEIGATVEADTDNFDSPEDAVVEVNNTLDALLQGDLEEAGRCVIDGEPTHAESWGK